LIQIATKDGTKTFFSEEFQENYHSLIGAQTESLRKFILPSKILEKNEISLIDIGFGLGYNSLALIESARKKGVKVSIKAFELYEKTVSSAVTIHNPENQNILRSLLKTGTYQEDGIDVEIFWGDAREKILKLPHAFADCVFLDPFSPPKNPELWTVEFFRKLSSKLNSKGKILTYSSSLAVIKALTKNGFFVGYTEPIGRKRGGLLASKKGDEILFPLSETDLFLLNVSAHSIPNYDKNFWDKNQIQAYREKLTDFSKKNQWLLPHKKSIKILER